MGSGVSWSCLHIQISQPSVQYKTRLNKEGVGVCGVWIFSASFPKITVASSIKHVQRQGLLPTFFCHLIPAGSSLHLGVGWDELGWCSMYVLYMPLPWWMTWFGLVCFPPLPLILCVLFPLCCTIRTLQWDTDPSVLQLQSDSELGYMSALLLFLLLFLCCDCAEMLDLLLLLFFPLLLNFQFDKFISFC